MSQIWGPTAPGKLFTQATEWKLALAAEQFLLQAGSQKVNGGVREIERLYVVPGRFGQQSRFRYRVARRFASMAFRILPQKKWLRLFQRAFGVYPR